MLVAAFLRYTYAVHARRRFLLRDFFANNRMLDGIVMGPGAGTVSFSGSKHNYMQILHQIYCLFTETTVDVRADHVFARKDKLVPGALVKHALYTRLGKEERAQARADRCPPQSYPQLWRPLLIACMRA